MRRDHDGDPPDGGSNAEQQGRRSVLAGAAALALGASVAPAIGATKPERMGLQPGDRFEVISGAFDGQSLRPEMLDLDAGPVEAFPLDPVGGVLRRGNRLNRVVALRLDPAEMDEETRSRSVDGVLIYSAICTHLNCTVNAWSPEERYLRCPCHLSQFAVLSGGSVTGGPARRPLPMVPLVLDPEGFVAAADGFNRKPGAKSA